LHVYYLHRAVHAAVYDWNSGKRVALQTSLLERPPLVKSKLARSTLLTPHRCRDYGLGLALRLRQQGTDVLLVDNVFVDLRAYRYRDFVSPLSATLQGAIKGGLQLRIDAERLLEAHDDETRSFLIRVLLDPLKESGAVAVRQTGAKQKCGAEIHLPSENWVAPGTTHKFFLPERDLYPYLHLSDTDEGVVQ